MSTDKSKGKSIHVSADSLPSGIGSPAHRALAAAGITRLEQFTSISEEELLKLHGVGPKAIRIIKESLRENGLAFAKAERSAQVSEKANRQIVRRASIRD
jgi:predicted flap endonuclease-1-like 5' DNA nuclease